MAHKLYDFWVPDQGASQYSLSRQQKDENALVVWNYFRSLGWTQGAVAGVLGNMEIECRMNPLVHSATQIQDALGLVQWNPGTKLTDWATRHDLDWQDGLVQCQRIRFEWENNLQWKVQVGQDVGITFDEYVSSTRTASHLAHVWRWQYEQADPETDDARREYAIYYYDLFTGIEPPEPPPEPPVFDFPYWLLFKFHKRKGGRIT